MYQEGATLDCLDSDARLVLKVKDAAFLASGVDTPVLSKPCTSNTLPHRRSFVGSSRARCWSRLSVLGAIVWAFIAKS